MYQFLRSFKFYRKSKGGKWWRVINYDYSERPHLWMWSEDNIEFPEFDGFFMDNMGTFVEKNSDHYSYYGWRNMKDNPTEQY